MENFNLDSPSAGTKIPDNIIRLIQESSIVKACYNECKEKNKTYIDFLEICIEEYNKFKDEKRDKFIPICEAEQIKFVRIVNALCNDCGTSMMVCVTRLRIVKCCSSCKSENVSCIDVQMIG